MASARPARLFAGGLLLAGLVSVVSALGADAAAQSAPELFQAEAARLRLAEEPHVRARLRDALFQTLVARERAALPAPTDEEVARYYASHHDDFTRPERIGLWRILVESEPEARQLIAQVQGAGGPERWRALSREKSLDVATKERGGDLGFVRPDGSTDVPEFRVDAALFAAARSLKDGELDVVAEGERFAAVWRRGHLKPVEVPLAAARPTIERLLVEQKLAARLDALVAELTKKHVSKRDDQLLELIPAAPSR